MGAQSAKLNLSFPKEQIVYQVQSYNHHGSVTTEYHSNGKKFWTLIGNKKRKKYTQEELLNKYPKPTSWKVEGHGFESVIKAMIIRENRFDKVNKILDQCLVTSEDRIMISEKKNNKLTLLKESWNNYKSTLIEMDKSSSSFKIMISSLDAIFVSYINNEMEKLASGVILDGNSGMNGVIMIVWAYIDRGIKIYNLSVYSGGN